MHSFYFQDFLKERPLIKAFCVGGGGWSEKAYESLLGEGVSWGNVSFLFLTYYYIFICFLFIFRITYFK